MNKIILITIFSISVLASCSKKPNENYDVAVNSEQSNVPVIDENSDTSPISEQKPEIILNQSQNAVEATRKMVREAQVNFTVKDVVKSTLAIEKMTIEAGGFIERKDIDFEVKDYKEQKIANGKIKIFEKVQPFAYMVLRVPSDRTPQVVNQLLPLMYFLNQQRYSAQRFELKLLEEKINQTQVIPRQARNAQLNEISELTKLEVQDRVQFSTISLQISQPSLVRERTDVDIATVAKLNGDHFWLQAWTSIQQGWRFILDLFIFLIAIWPIYLLVILGLIIYRLIKPFIDKIK